MVDKTIETGFNVVKQYDPALYQRMQADKWQPMSDLLTWFTKGHATPMEMLSTIDVVMGSFGATKHGTELSFINPDTIGQFARHFHIDPKYMIAAVMAHEYDHTHDSGPQDDKSMRLGEIKAFTAGHAFAVKLPEPAKSVIVNETDKDLKHAKSDIHDYLRGQ